MAVKLKIPREKLNFNTPNEFFSNIITKFAQKLQLLVDSTDRLNEMLTSLVKAIVFLRQL